MSWTDRQRAMLEAMGLKLWLPPDVGSNAAPASVASPATAPSAVAAPATASRGAPAAAAPAVSRRAPEGDVAVAELPTSTSAPAPAPRRVAEVLAKALPAAAPAPAVEPASAPAVSREAIARLDWPGLRDEVAACRACTLCESRKQTVFGVGNERAHWMVVGEAPGEQEDLQGEPFVGAAGKLLDSMLRSIGLSRGEGTPERQVYIANTLKCRPPRNRNPDPAELAQCEPFLERQIALIQPRIILAMGRFAVQQLLRSQEPIGKLRGRVHRYQGVPLIVTYHPAYLLRNLPDKARAWEDLCLAMQTLAGDAASAPASGDGDGGG